MQAPDYYFLPMLRMISIEKLVIRIKNHVNCTAEVFWPRLLIVFCRRRCRQDRNRLIRTHVSHGDNSKNISLLSLSVLQDPTSSMICTRKFSRNISADLSCHPINEELKMRLTYSNFTMQLNYSRIQSRIQNQTQLTYSKINLIE